jgi:hypothetical protein
MHKTQQLVVAIGFAIIVLMGIFPPWSFVDDNKVSHPMGYAPIWKPPINRSHDSAEVFGMKFQFNMESQAANAIDMPKLMMQIAVAAMVTCGAAFLFKRGAT